MYQLVMHGSRVLRAAELVEVSVVFSMVHKSFDALTHRFNLETNICENGGLYFLPTVLCAQVLYFQVPDSLHCTLSYSPVRVPCPVLTDFLFTRFRFTVLRKTALIKTHHCELCFQTVCLSCGGSRN